ncbi:hypothetical protein [Psychrobacillus sp.]|uniref:hypothetical protein n=1 Tax=Psychrobacillus sp. TaxID=1871623 RepID=UPI0028BF100E|nr:hypothetical protein [Psychrobacillus sp.]
MDNKIKKEINKIDVPKNLHERSILGVKKAKAELPKRKSKNPLLAVAVVTIIGFGILLTPVGQAAINGIFEVKKLEKDTPNEGTSYGYFWEAVAGSDVVPYDSLEDLENSYPFHIPFPSDLLLKEEGSKAINYGARIDEDGKFLSYQYTLMTVDKMYDVMATNIESTLPAFEATTEDGTAIEKEVFINGKAATLLGIKEMNSCSIYFENDQWQIVISSFVLQNHEEQSFDLIEKEMIQIAESIQW